MFSYYKRLRKDLDSCAAEGLLEKAEADKIYGLILARKRKMPDASLIITVLGGAFMAFGTGLIISYNWDKIGGLTKIIAYLSVYLACAAAAVKFEEKKLISIPAEILWFFMPALGFGLYGQIFQLSSDPLKPFMAWAAISAPLVWLLNRRYLTVIFELLFYGIIYYCLSNDTVFSVTKTDPAGLNFILSSLFAALMFFGLRAAYIKLDGKVPPRLYAVFAAYLMFFSLSHIQGNRAIISLGFAAWALSLSGKDFPYRYFMIFCIAAFIFSFKDLYRDISWRAESQQIDAVKYTLSIIITAAAYIWSAIEIIKSQKTRVGYPVLAVLAFSILRALGIFRSESDSFIMNILALWLYIAAILHGSEIRDKRFINLGIAMTAVIIISRFFDLFGKLGFLQTGFGFIVSGAALIAVAYYVNSWRKNLIKDMEEE